MARELWHVALSDLCTFLMTVLCATTIDISNFTNAGHVTETPTLDSLCKVCFGSNLFQMTSALVEAHIALATAASILRCTRALACLSRGLWLAWPVGFVLGFSVVYFDAPHWDQKANTCNVGMVEGAVNGEKLKSLYLTFLIGICVVVYIFCTSFMGLHSSQVAYHRVWNRAKYFSLASIVSLAPQCVFSLVASTGAWIDPGTSEAVFFIVFSFANSNGLLNALVYAGQCRHIKRALQQGQHPRAGDGPHDFRSFLVQFKDQTGSEVRDVECVYDEARRNALRDMWALPPPSSNPGEPTEIPGTKHELKKAARRAVASFTQEEEELRRGGNAEQQTQQHIGVAAEEDCTLQTPLPLTPILEEDVCDLVLGCLD